MVEVIERVKGELSEEYEPVIRQLKEEGNAKDLFYQREMEKQKKDFDYSQIDVTNTVQRLELQVKEWELKLIDKLREMENLQKIIEEKRVQYNDLSQKK